MDVFRSKKENKIQLILPCFCQLIPQRLVYMGVFLADTARQVKIARAAGSCISLLFALGRRLYICTAARGRANSILSRLDDASYEAGSGQCACRLGSGLYAAFGVTTKKHRAVIRKGVIPAYRHGRKRVHIAVTFY